MWKSIIDFPEDDSETVILAVSDSEPSFVRRDRARPHIFVHCYRDGRPRTMFGETIAMIPSPHTYCELPPTSGNMLCDLLDQVEKKGTSDHVPS